MASLTAARLGAAGSPAAHGGGPAALVLFSYPLHRPGGDDWQARSAHWPAIACPVLLLSGDRDPFARLGRLREAVGLLRDAELVVFPGVGHGLGGRLPAALDLAAAFLREHTPD
jgi:predicted alpha/beta-hydrolase family hydrolase